MRASSGTIRRRRRKKILKETKGFRGARKKLYRTAKDALAKAKMHAYIDRRRKKRDFRRLWIIRISAACKMHGINYSKFIHALKKLDIGLNRKQLSQIAIEDPESFAKIVEKAKKALSA